jgi:ribosomal protein S18 acetylase RimI-like enzyme
MLSLSKEQLPVVDVQRLLDDFDIMFSPTLSSHIDLLAFAEKLAPNALFILCRSSEEIVGYIAFYENRDTRVCYIPSVCVKDTYRSNGIASRMMDYLVTQSHADINTISLEVRKNNDSAIRFYRKQNFVVTEDRGDKLLMNKYLIKER